MKLEEYVNELRLEFKIMFTNRWKLDARRKWGSYGI